MSVFTAPTPTVDLPLIYGHPEQGDTVWALVLDMGTSEPWIRPCDSCTVLDDDCSHQAGCAACRGRGWFDTSTGLPVGLWMWRARSVRAQWTLHTLLPELLRATGHEDDAARVDALPRVTLPLLEAKRITGSGFLRDLTSRLQHAGYELLIPSPTGPGRIPTPGNHGEGRAYPALQRAGEAARDFTTSHLGWHAWTAAHEAVRLLRTQRHQGAAVQDVDELLDRLDRAYDEEHPPALMVEHDADPVVDAHLATEHA